MQDYTNAYLNIEDIHDDEKAPCTKKQIEGMAKVCEEFVRDFANGRGRSCFSILETMPQAQRYNIENYEILVENMPTFGDIEIFKITYKNNFKKVTILATLENW